MQNNDPLKPGYNFDAHLVAGLTPIIEGDELDFVIDRPNGMKGSSSTSRAKVKERYFMVMMLLMSKLGIYCYFHQAQRTSTIVKKTTHHGFTAGSIFVLVLFGMTGCVGMNNEMVCI